MTTHRLDLLPAPHGSTRVMVGTRTMVVGRGAVICAAARIMIAERTAKPDDRLEAYRGSMLSMAGPVGAWAALQAVAGAPEALASCGSS